MVFTNLFPGGVYQLRDVLQNGYWHARSAEFLSSIRLVEWLRMPGDLTFALLGVIPMVIAVFLSYRSMRRTGGGRKPAHS
jgi:nitric oxide reductase subunit B